MSKVLSQYWSVQRTDGLNIQSCCFLQQILYLLAVFSNDTDEVTTRLIIPRLLHIKSTEFSKSVCREQYFVTGIISNDYFRPVYHRSFHKRQSMLAKS